MNKTTEKKEMKRIEFVNEYKEIVKNFYNNELSFEDIPIIIRKPNIIKSNYTIIQNKPLVTIRILF